MEQTPAPGIVWNFTEFLTVLDKPRTPKDRDKSNTQDTLLFPCTQEDGMTEFV